MTEKGQRYTVKFDSTRRNGYHWTVFDNYELMVLCSHTNKDAAEVVCNRMNEREKNKVVDHPLVIGSFLDENITVVKFRGSVYSVGYTRGQMTLDIVCMRQAERDSVVEQEIDEQDLNDYILETGIRNLESK